MSDTTTKPKKPKAPTDHKPKGAGKPKVTRTETGHRVKIHGVEVEVLTAAMDDWELLEALADLNADDPRTIAKLPVILKRSLSPADHAAAMDAIRDKTTGRVSLAAGISFVKDLFGALNPNA